MTTGVRRTLGSVIGVALAAWLVAGCTTLPAPRGESDTALVIPVEKDQSTEGTSTFGYYEVSIARSGDESFHHSVNVYANSDVEVITGLKPGSYYFESYRFHYKDGGTGSRGDVGGSFLLKAGSITISPKVFRVVLFKKDEDASQEWMGIRWSDTNEQQRQKMVRQLEESENFGAWDIVGGDD